MKLERLDKIVLFRALQLGDMLCAIPAIRALHKAYPLAKITLVGLPWSRILLERFPAYFHSLIIFPGYPGFSEQPADKTSFPGFLEQVQQSKFDLALQMHGSGIISNPLVDLFAAKNVAGFYTKDNFCPDKNLFIEYPSNIHEINRHLHLMDFLGISEAGTELEFPILEQDKADFEQLELILKPKEYVIIHPGARDMARRWPPESFANVADYCSKQGLKVVITGTRDELEVVERVVQSMTCKPIVVAGKTSFGAVAVLIKNAAALISNCTGVSHIAAALKTKSIVVSLNPEPARWAPLDKSVHTTIEWASASYEDVKKEVAALLMGVGV
jgi:ADP-heptose:LPS heptosyltransferase